MKRLLATCTLIIALSLPALSGHIQAGGSFCEGTCAETGKCSMCGQSCTPGGRVRTAATPINPDFIAIAEAVYYSSTIR